MDTGKIIRDLSALSIEQQKEIADFIVFLKRRYKKSAQPKACKFKKQKLSKESFIGIWQNREDLRDSAAWVRNIRCSEWSR